MVCGDVPFENQEQISEHKISFPKKVLKEVRDIIQKCLLVSPEDRPTWEELKSHNWLKG